MKTPRMSLDYLRDIIEMMSKIETFTRGIAIQLLCQDSRVESVRGESGNGDG